MDSLRRAYLRLLSEHAASSGLRVVGYCPMTNHVHIVGLPETEASMANTFRHVNGRFAQYWNTEWNRSGHLWQNRYYSCPVEEAAVGRVLAYVERNPVRAGIVMSADDYEWSSAREHLGRAEWGPMLDAEWWSARWTAGEWRQVLKGGGECKRELREIREATYAGRPLGSAVFVSGVEEKLGRKLGGRAGGRLMRESDGDCGNQLWLLGEEGQ